MWTRKRIACQGLVLFRGPLPPRVEDLDGLAAAGVSATALAAGKGERWALKLVHPAWGEARLALPAGPLDLPTEVLAFDPRLSDDEKQLVGLAATALDLSCDPRTGNLLRDRKRLLRFLAASLGSHGLAVCDTQAQAFWSRDMLAEELAHDADLDIQSLYTVHLVHEGDASPYWLHSHGLRELGQFDFDILAPSPDVHGSGADLLRAIAFAIVEGKTRQAAAFPLARPGGDIRLVPVDLFLRRAGRAIPADWREGLDEEHTRGHAVACDPAPTGLRALFGDRLRPSRFLSQELPEEPLILFSNSASALMGERARATSGVLRELARELGDLGLPVLAKLGLAVDGGDADDREHLWFEVHGIGPDSLDATLINQPYYIERLKNGDRGQHPLELLTDWTIMTPLGNVSPRQMQAVREVRAHRPEVERMLAEGRQRPQS